jgi:hypothetical protein
MKSSACAARAAAIDLGLGGIGPAVADVVADRAAEEHGLLQRDADVAAQRRQVQVPHVMAVDRDAPTRDTS